MHIFTKLEAFHPAPQKPLVLSLGNFDGLHLGHQEILKRTIFEARRLGGVPAVFTFSEHPQGVLHPEMRPKLLTCNAHRLYLLNRLGIENCFFMPFTEKFSKIPAEKFITDILVKDLKIKKAVLGYNARFGFGRRGDSHLMKEYGAKFAYEFEEVGPVRILGEVVSSSRVRKLVEAGELEETTECLGRPFAVWGEVVKGDGRGASIGFPTANLELSGEVMPPQGVYAVYARILDLQRKMTGEGREEFSATSECSWNLGALNYGSRPTFKKEGKLCAEVHLLDFKGDLYGKTLEVAFGPRLRGERTFASKEELQRQIGEDVAQARRHFLAFPRPSGDIQTLAV